MLDFPAAHSMDTTWFAIDADGYVGIFWSGEEGAIPKNLPNLVGVKNVIEYNSEVLEAFLGDRQELLLHDSLIKIEHTFADWGTFHELEWDFLSIEALLREIDFHEQYTLSNPNAGRDLSTIDNLVLQLSTEQVMDDLKSQATIIIRFADEKILVYVDKCNLEWLKKAVESGTVIAGTETIFLEDNLSWLGWHEYSCDSWRVPYERSYSIERPILYSDLPPEITEHIRVTRLKNIRFSENSKIQPIEHMSCYTWGNHQGWIDTNGVEHDRFPEYPDEV